MVSVRQAKELLYKSIISCPDSETIPLVGSVGRILSQDLLSALDLPPFDNSAVDGYAVASVHHSQYSWKISGEVKAGDNIVAIPGPEDTIQIFTGAPVPENADSIIMQEHGSVSGNFFSVDVPPVPGANIRKKGSQIKKGEVAVAKGSLITPATIGFIASLGISQIKVTRQPTIAIVVTGNELEEPGTALSNGKIYESNSPMLVSTLTHLTSGRISTYKVKDDQQALLDVVEKVLMQYDFILFTGGISVGKYDYVRETLLKSGVQEVFYKVKQKPGKPLFYGKYQEHYVFALPGNPAAVMTCFYEYVFPAIQMFMGAANFELPATWLPLASDYEKKTGLTHFLKSCITSSGVLPLTGQESYILRSFHEANALICLGEEADRIKQGTMVEVHLLPY